MGINPLSSKGFGVWIRVIYILRLKIIFILILCHDLIPGEENGNPLQYSCLENPMDGGAW